MHTLPRNKGFTLVELAISLVVIGLLVAIGTGMVGPLMNTLKVRESKENLGAAVEAVNSWAAGNNRLPDASTAATGFKAIVATPVDAWNRDLIYQYDAVLAPSSASKDTICGRRSTVLTLTDSNTGATVSNVAYLLFSTGDDASSQTTIGGIPVTASGSLSAATTITANTTDDLVRWVTLDELRTKIGCQGAQLRVVNNELPYGTVATSYTAVLAADGGYLATGNTYRWCIETANNLFQAAGGFTLNGSAGGAGTNPTGVASSCTSAVAIASQLLTIGGTPLATADATSHLTIVVWDDNGNEARKKIVLTVHPQN